MTPAEIQAIATSIQKHIDKLFNDRFDREVLGHIESEAKNILYTLAGDTIRDLIRKEVTRRVDVEVTVKVKNA